LEAGVNVHAIQKYLGHASLATTLLYFHLTRMGQANNEAIIESLMTFPKEVNND
jgi:site-specific recombinase XerD